MTQEGRSSVVLEDCLKEPELPPSPLLDETIYQVNFHATSLLSTFRFQSVVGILDKYVNIGQGWRKRLFLLQGGVVRYYKVKRIL